MDTIGTIRALGDDHAQLSSGMHALFARIMHGFRVLQRRQFAAPWQRPRD